MRILILGGTGMMGHMACRVFSCRHRVYATARVDLAKRTHWRSLFGNIQIYKEVDCLDEKKMREVIAESRPEVILNCIGVVKQLKEAENPIHTIPVNALFPHTLAGICEEYGSKLIHLSTDCVFSGTRGNYREDDIPDPVDLYGRSKLLGEVTYGNHLTIRTSMIGRQLAGNSGLIEWFLGQKGRSVQGYTQMIFSGLTTSALAEIILQVVESHRTLRGVYHIASSPISKFRLLSWLNDRLHLGIALRPYETVKCNRSLDASRFFNETGIPMPPWDKMIDDMEKDVGSYEMWRR